MRHIVSARKITIDPTKIASINKYEKLNTIKKLRTFLGICNFCRDYIPDFDKNCIPLYEILKGEKKRSIRKINWSIKQDSTFEEIKRQISKATYKTLPDPSKPFNLITDAF